MNSKIKSLIEDLEWEIKDREVNYIPAGDLEKVANKLRRIVESEETENIEPG